MIQIDLATDSAGSHALMRLGTLAQRLGGAPELREASAAEARYGALMRRAGDDNPATPALVAWAVAVSDQGDWAPPSPSGLTVGAARLWASRSRWGKPALSLSAAALLAFLGVAGVQWIRAGLAEREAARVAQHVQGLEQRLQSARSWLDVRPELVPEVAEIVDPTLDALGLQLDQAEAAMQIEADPSAADRHLAQFEATRGQLQLWSRVSAAVERAALAEVPDGFARVLAGMDTQLREALARRDANEALEAANALAGLPQALAQFEDRPALEFADDEGQAALLAARARTDESLADGRLQRAATLLAAERELAQAISQVYTVRIVDRPGAKSGVWRYSVDSPSARDFYLVVEAVDPSGAVLSLPIENEETQRTSRVRTFAVRVPEATYNRYRDEKVAKGRIEQREIGSKARGALHMQFDLPSAGGFITEW